MGNLYMQELQQSTAENSNPIEMKEIATSVVYPITRDIITKYKQLISDPLVQDDWTKGMCKELVRLYQGYEEKRTGNYVKGMNRVLSMDLGYIKTIPKDQVVTHAQIVVYYQTQKRTHIV